MTKRRNPFDDAPFLHKMHIGIKEVNLGVNHEENMKKVYENTMKMLFNGSTKPQNRITKVQNGVSTPQTELTSFQNGMLSLQNVVPEVHSEALIAYNGTSAIENGMPKIQNGSVNGNNHQSQHPKMMKNQNEKGNGMNPCRLSNLQICCYFCERILCTTSCRICENCNNKFCHLCSVLQYNSEEETAVCLSCM